MTVCGSGPWGQAPRFAAQLCLQNLQKLSWPGQLALLLDIERGSRCLDPRVRTALSGRRAEARGRCTFRKGSWALGSSGNNVSGFSLFTVAQQLTVFYVLKLNCCCRSRLTSQKASHR